MFDLGSLKYSIDVDDKGANQSLKTFDQNAKTVGANLTKSLTLPISLAGAAIIKLASDFEVSSRKFATAFKGSEAAASAAVANLNKNFGLAEAQATKLLANTGDLLKGFGATSEEALKLSDSAQQLAASLAAYNGVPIVEASEAIKSALVGETESLKRLGVVVNEAAIDQQRLADGTEDLTGQAESLAKAQAVLTLAYAQSGDAIASMAINQDTLAFQTQALIGDVQDLAIKFGDILLPIIKEVVVDVREAIEYISSLSIASKKTILAMAGIAAIAGPVIAAIGAISTAFAFLAANPAIAAIIAIAAVTTAVVALSAAAKQNNLDEFIAQFGEVAEIAGLTGEELEKLAANQDRIVGIFSRLQGMVLTTEQLSENVSATAVAFGISDETLIKILRSSESISSEMKTQLTEVDKVVAAQAEELALVNAISVSREEAAALSDANYQLRREELATAREEIELARQAREELEAAQLSDVEKQIQARLKAQQEYYKEVQTLETQRQLDLISAEELDQGRVAAAEKYANALIDAGYDGANATEQGNIALRQMVAILKEAKDSAGGLSEVENEWVDKLFEQSASAIQILERNRDRAIAIARERGQSVLEIEEYYDEEARKIEEKRIEDQTAQALEYVDMLAGAVTNILSGIAEINDNHRQTELQNLQIALDEATAIREEQLEQEYSNLDNALQNGLISQEEYDKEKERLQKASDKAAVDAQNALNQKKYEAELEAFKERKKIAIAEIWINAAIAVVRAFAENNWVTAIIVGGLALVAAGIQTGVVASQTPPKPPVKLAMGGIANNPGPGINSIVGEAGPEAILPLNDRTFQMLGSAISTELNDGGRFNSNGSSPALSNSMPPPVQDIYLDGEKISKLIIGDYVNTRRVVIDGEAVS